MMKPKTIKVSKPETKFALYSKSKSPPSGLRQIGISDHSSTKFNLKKIGLLVKDGNTSSRKADHHMEV
jgi:hypothetical protein